MYECDLSFIKSQTDLKYGILCKGGYRGKIKSWSPWIEEMETRLSFVIVTIWLNYEAVISRNVQIFKGDFRSTLLGVFYEDP